MAFLEKSDAVIIQTDDYKSSKGTLGEIERAKELGIPVFYDLTSLICYEGEI